MQQHITPTTMTSEVVWDFLNVPGIAGIALLERSQPGSFCCLDPRLLLRDRELLAQGILQVLSTMPEGFAEFELQFLTYQVHLRRLESGMTLLVLSHGRSRSAQYAGAFETLCQSLVQAGETATQVVSQLAAQLSSQQEDPTEPQLSTVVLHPKSAAEVSPSDVLLSMPSTNAPQILVSEVVTALNRATQVAVPILGATIVAKNWQSTRPDEAWLANWTIGPEARLSAPQGIVATPQAISEEQQLLIQRWCQAFGKKCTVIIRDFPTLLARQKLSPTERLLLLEPPSGKKPI